VIVIRQTWEESELEGIGVGTSDPGTQRSWRGFEGGRWMPAIDVRDFIVRHLAHYEGNGSFLTEPSDRTRAVWPKLQPYFQEEQRKSVFDIDVANSIV
jgi:formate C-acetyltransferase